MKMVIGTYVWSYLFIERIFISFSHVKFRTVVESRRPYPANSNTADLRGYMRYRHPNAESLLFASNTRR